jgi:hypothetical protein
LPPLFELLATPPPAYVYHDTFSPPLGAHVGLGWPFLSILSFLLTTFVVDTRPTFTKKISNQLQVMSNWHAVTMH